MTDAKTMLFEGAMTALRGGLHVKRSDWAENTYVAMKPGYPAGIPANEVHARTHGIEPGTPVVYQPYFEKRTGSHSFTQWSPSSEDVLADDWAVVTHENKELSND